MSESTTKYFLKTIYDSMVSCDATYFDTYLEIKGILDSLHGTPGLNFTIDSHEEFILHMEGWKNVSIIGTAGEDMFIPFETNPIGIARDLYHLENHFVMDLDHLSEIYTLFKTKGFDIEFKFHIWTEDQVRCMAEL
jgi:hypothetical protein